VGKDVWEQQYSNGTWNYLFSEDEAGHYFSICSQIKKYAEVFSILDIGCGNGVLYDYLHKNLEDNLLYNGIDISENAVEIAKTKFPSSEFNKADYEYAAVTGRFDVVVFNETLYYFVKPMKTLAKAFRENLKNGGVLVISMCEDTKHNGLWERINAEYRILAEETVENKKGQKWTIKTIASLK
jgi:2-polyprenyl-3-methyl-5-hydroxy-6-metoxy-1,4-benzoquinol methylase